MLVVGVLLYGAYSYRVSRLLELERVRTRIASDLHDDIGAALSRIAVLSEVARLEAGGDKGPVTARLSVIASASREVLDSMSDIVWAINPRRDQMRDLIQRMRRFASDVFTARAIAFSFRAPQDDHPLHVTADVRRHVFLVFKEAVNNVVRHSGATQADVDIRVDGNWMTLTVCDNGRGFDPGQRGDGHGLVSMNDRACMMGGRLEVISHAGGGTMLRLTAPLNVAIKEHNRRIHRSEANEGPDHGAAT
jgi:signal transduction histidine kinase